MVWESYLSLLVFGVECNTYSAACKPALEVLASQQRGDVDKGLPSPPWRWL